MAQRQATSFGADSLATDADGILASDTKSLRGDRSQEKIARILEALKTLTPLSENNLYVRTYVD